MDVTVTRDRVFEDIIGYLEKIKGQEVNLADVSVTMKDDIREDSLLKLLTSGVIFADKIILDNRELFGKVIDFAHDEFCEPINPLLNPDSALNTILEEIYASMFIIALSDHENYFRSTVVDSDLINYFKDHAPKTLEEMF